MAPLAQEPVRFQCFTAAHQKLRHSMDASQLYPLGMSPTGLPVEVVPVPTPLTRGELPTLSLLSRSCPEEAVPLPVDDMDLLAQILQECHLEETGHTVRAQSVVPEAPACPPHLSNVLGILAADSLEGKTTQPVSLDQWTEEVMRSLGSCSSRQEAITTLRNVLGAFERQLVDPDRAKALKFANSVLLRSFRNLHARRREADLQRERAEEVNTALAAELARCQEALRASERAKGYLQYHLQLMNTANTAAGGM